jgi:diguanylate cyclase (GGDEF)-like protein
MTVLSQIFDNINIGLVILDKELNVQHWNRWMALHSGIGSDKITGFPIFDFFPTLDTPKFIRNCKSVFSFGNLSYFSQKLHHYLFPFKPINTFKNQFEFMQQSVTLAPIRDDNNLIYNICMIVQDVTDIVSYEKKLLDLTIKDALTGAFNRRYLEMRLKDEFERHKRHAQQLSMVMFDIDFFKKVNDTYGHQCGDFILQSLVSIIRQNTRKIDCLARYGGEEFCCLLPETDLDQAIQLAERFRSSIETHQNMFKEQVIPITISLGVSKLAEGDTEESFIKKADDALYEAKKSGRNKVVAL